MSEKDDWDDEPEASPTKIWLRRLVLIAIILGLVFGGWQLLKGLFTGKSGPQKQVTKIALMPDTPPPPPPPPPKEPPKEQPKEQPKEVKMEQPKPQEAPQPPAEALKMEGAAGDGPSPFQAGSVTKDYEKGDVNTIKIAPKKGMGAYAWFTGQIKGKIEEALAAQKELANAQYRVVVHVWFTRDGRVERAELQGSSGEVATDELIKKALAEMPAMAEAPPDDMPQPVKLRVTSKKTG